MTNGKKYLATTRRIWREFDKIEDGLVRSSLGLLRQLQQGLQVEIRRGDTISAHEMRGILERVNTLVNLYEAEMINIANAGIILSFNKGIDSLIAPLVTIGQTIAPLTANQSIVSVLSNLTVDLIVNIASDARRRIITQVRITALGQQNTLNAMQNINSILGVDARGRVLTKTGSQRGVTARAETIFRTEMNRAFSMGHHEQQQELLKTMPALLKAWIATGDTRTRKSHLMAHAKYNATPIPANKPFVVGGHKMKHPHDPTAPAKETVNCRCREITLPPDVTLPPSPLDTRIEKQLEIRGK